MRIKRQKAAEKARAALQRRWIQVALVLLILVGGAGGTFWTAHHVADSVTITITDYGAATAQTVYSETINDMGRARALQYLLNHTGTISPFVSFSCPQGGSSYVYDFHFSFLGIQVQRMRGGEGGCGLLGFSTLNIKLPLMHAWPSRDTWHQLVGLTGMPDYSGYRYSGYAPQPVG